MGSPQKEGVVPYDMGRSLVRGRVGRWKGEVTRGRGWSPMIWGGRQVRGKGRLAKKGGHRREGVRRGVRWGKGEVVSERERASLNCRDYQCEGDPVRCHRD